MASLVVVNIVFFSRALPIVFWIFGMVEALSFFYFSNLLTRKWADYSPRLFAKKLFTTALVIRVVWVIFSYFFYLTMTGQPFEFSSADATMYDRLARAFASVGIENYEQVFADMPLSDRGYGTYLGIIYMITGDSIFIARIIKAILGAFLSVLIYRLTTRNFGEETGKMAGIFCMLMPNLIYYSGLHLKEAEMVFLVVAFIERADYIIRSSKFSIVNFILPVLLAAILFTFRTVLGAAALFAFITALLLSSAQVVKKTGKRILLTIWVLLAIAYFAGGKIAMEVEEVWAARTDNQSASLEWRAKREGGNKFATLASKSVFAPMIFVIPFPTMVNTPGQENQQLLHGGNYVKNILAFFVMYALFLIIKERKWKDYLLIIFFTIVYLAIMALSAFAQSERFHQPVLPFLMVLAAYGISRATNQTKKYFTWYMVFLFVAIAGWSWFNLAGRGMA